MDVCLLMDTCPREDSGFEIIGTQLTVKGSLHLQPFPNILGKGTIVSVEGCLCPGTVLLTAGLWSHRMRCVLCDKNRDHEFYRFAPHKCISPIPLSECLAFFCP